MRRRRAAVAAVWLAFLAAASLWLALRLEVASDLTLFMPRTADTTDRLLLATLREGPLSRVVLIGLEGDSEAALAAASDALAERLGESTLFTRVANGRRLIGAGERERLLAHRYLLSPAIGSHSFSADALRAALEGRLDELRSTLPVVDKALVARDPTGAFRAMLETWRGAGEPARRHGVWFAGDASRALLVAETHAAGFDPEAQARAIDDIRAAAGTAAPGARLVLSGPGVFAVAARDRIRTQVRDLSIAASALVVLILALAYRSALLVALGALPLATGVVCATIALVALFGEVHGIALAFGVTVLGVAIDYPVHVFSHLHAGESVASSLARVWPTLRLSVLTTAMGYLAMTGAEFPGLIQLAVFAIVGLLCAAAATRWGLPALLPSRWQPRQRTTFAAGLARRARPGPRSLLLVLAAAVLAAIYLLHRGETIWEDDLAALSPAAPDALAQDRALRAQLPAPAVSQVVAIRASDAQAALARSERLAARLPALVADGVVDGFDLAARYVPSVATQLARRRALPARAELERALAVAMEGMPFRADAFTGFVDDVERAREQRPLTPADLAGTVAGLRAGPLLFEIVDSRVDSREDSGAGRWVALITFTGVDEPAALERWVRAHGGEGAVYLDTKAETEDLLASFRGHALVRVGWGALLIALALWIGLRSLGRVPMVLLPGIAAIVVDMALLVLAGTRLTLFHLVALLLVLGISIDYALFFNRDERDAAERERTLHGLLVCALSTCAVFALLSLSSLPVLDALGRTVALGVALSFLAALVVSRASAARGAG